MAVTAEYLSKIRRAVRASENSETDAELADIIEECRADLAAVGVSSEKAGDESDSAVLGAVRCFARWKYGMTNPDAPANRDDYMILRDELRKRKEYNGGVAE